MTHEASGKLLELAAKCEAMPSMDGFDVMAIWRACFPMPKHIRQSGFENIGDGIGPYTPEFSAWNQARATVQKFAVNGAWLDAAMTLIQGPEEYPDSQTFLLDCATQTTVYGQPVAHVWSEAGKHTAKARTPALALCAAALRARAHTLSGDQ